MCAAIETIRSGQIPEAIIQKEVTCIFCGLPTPVPAKETSKVGGRLPCHISIIRCEVCGKEAPYPTSDFLELSEMCRVRSI
jgi:hypothetical protein